MISKIFEINDLEKVLHIYNSNIKIKYNNQIFIKQYNEEGFHKYKTRLKIIY